MDSNENQRCRICHTAGNEPLKQGSRLVGGFNCFNPSSSMDLWNHKTICELDEPTHIWLIQSPCCVLPCVEVAVFNILSGPFSVRVCPCWLAGYNPNIDMLLVELNQAAFEERSNPSSRNKNLWTIYNQPPFYSSLKPRLFGMSKFGSVLVIFFGCFNAHACCSKPVCHCSKAAFVLKSRFLPILVA